MTKFHPYLSAAENLAETVRFRKGDTVKLNIAKCFTEASHYGGERDYPLSNWHNDDAGIVYGQRPTTSEETERWYTSGGYCIEGACVVDGEGELPPQYVFVPLHKDDIFTVLKGRARLRLEIGDGYVKIAREDGKVCFTKRELLEHV